MSKHGMSYVLDSSTPLSVMSHVVGWGVHHVVGAPQFLLHLVFLQPGIWLKKIIQGLGLVLK